MSLRDADVGERVVLLNYEHLAVPSPYRSRYAIHVREDAQEARLDVNQVPEVLRTRLLSVRAFDDGGMLRAADVAWGLRPATEEHESQESTPSQTMHAATLTPGVLERQRAESAKQQAEACLRRNPADTHDQCCAAMQDVPLAARATGARASP